MTLDLDWFESLPLPPAIPGPDANLSNTVEQPAPPRIPFISLLHQEGERGEEEIANQRR